MVNNMNYKFPRYFIISIVIHWVIGMTCMLLIVSQTVSISFKGFAVDSSGKLYIGKEEWIDVYENDELVNKITTMTSRGYVFTIQEDDTILLASGTTILHIIDLNGNIIDEKKADSVQTFYSLSRKKEFVAKNGNRYFLEKSWGRIKILKVDENVTEIIYKMPLLDYITKITFTLVFISFGIFIPMFMYKERRTILPQFNWRS